MDWVGARVAGGGARAGAPRLTGAELFIAREKLPAPEDEDEFYLADLVGLRAETRSGEELGVIVAVRNFGAGDILEVAPKAGGETLLFPFTKAIAPIVSVAEGRVVIEPPAEVEGETQEP
jgi:16S rRNA processing protein RimM